MSQHHFAWPDSHLDAPTCTRMPPIPFLNALHTYSLTKHGIWMKWKDGLICTNITRHKMPLTRVQKTSPIRHLIKQTKDTVNNFSFLFVCLNSSLMAEMRVSSVTNCWIKHWIFTYNVWIMIRWMIYYYEEWTWFWYWAVFIHFLNASHVVPVFTRQSDVRKLGHNVPILTLQSNVRKAVHIVLVFTRQSDIRKTEHICGISWLHDWNLKRKKLEHG